MMVMVTTIKKTQQKYDDDGERRRRTWRIIFCKWLLAALHENASPLVWINRIQGTKKIPLDCAIPQETKQAEDQTSA